MENINLLRGAILIALIIGFVAIVLWAWSKKRKPDFEEAARMPLEEDEKTADAEPRRNDKE